MTHGSLTPSSEVRQILHIDLDVVVQPLSKGDVRAFRGRPRALDSGGLEGVASDRTMRLLGVVSQ